MNVTDLPERIQSKVMPVVDGCWLWNAAQNSNGYGNVWWNETYKMAHRATYEILVGAIPKGKELDHLCRTRSCVNPDHLEPVTHKENIRRGRSWNGEKTHCDAAGHPLDDAYATVTGGRQCRPCHLLSTKLRKQRQKKETK